MFKCLNNDEQKNSTKGIGIGLGVSEKIVKAMGGEIGIKTAKGVGTRLSFRMVRDEVVEPRVKSLESIRTSEIEMI